MNPCVFQNAYGNPLPLDQLNQSEVINLTPHPIVFQTESATNRLTFQPSGQEVRIKYRKDNRNVTSRPHGRDTAELIGLPEKREGTIYLVSDSVLERIDDPARDDVFSPDTKNFAVRGFDGEIVAVAGFIGVAAAHANVPHPCIIGPPPFTYLRDKASAIAGSRRRVIDAVCGSMDAFWRVVPHRYGLSRRSPMFNEMFQDMIERLRAIPCTNSPKSRRLLRQFLEQKFPTETLPYAIYRSFD